MTSLRRLVVLAACGLLSAAAVAQLDAAQQPEGTPAARPTPSAPPDLTAERSEDVEVLRRILNKSLGLPNKVTATQQNWIPLQFRGFEGYSGQPWFSGQPGGIGGYSGFGQQMYGGHFITTQPTVGPFDGVYLAGHGVVFTLKVPEQTGITLSPPTKAFGLAETCTKCHATEPVSRDALEPTLGTVKTPTEWDRTQQELRGGKQPTGQPPKGPGKLTRQQICEPGNLTERVVMKLWQNAKHVRHLPAGERVTVVVTYDGVSGSARDRQILDPVSGEVYGSQPLTLTNKGQPVPHGFTAEEGQQLTLGDLHLKQNKPKEAAAAYERALSRFKEPVYKMTPNVGVASARVMEMVGEIEKGVRGAYARLAQAHLAAGNTDKAAAALDMARKFKVDLASGPTPAKEKGVPVPAKLVISVARADLDGDLIAFKKAVRVELTGFPPADRKK